MTDQPDRLHDLNRRQRALDREIQQELHRVLRQNWKSEGQSRQGRAYAAELLQLAEPKHVDIPMVSQYINNGMSMHSAISWTRQLVSHSELKIFSDKPINWLINGKRSAYKFIDALGVRRPTLHTEHAITLQAFEPKFPAVLKPTAGAGASGVYILVRPNHIYYAKTGKLFSTWRAAETHARDLLNSGQIRRDSWISEELVLGNQNSLEPARDLKFYSFYGEVSFIGEIRRYPRVEWDYWSAPGERINAPGNWRRARFKGDGPSEQDLETAKFISRSIPYPFMRIDMIRGDSHLFFGEFTPRPGSSMLIKPEWDRRMGEAWFRAEQRLHEDLLVHGKDFGAFLKSTGLRVS